MASSKPRSDTIVLQHMLQREKEKHVSGRVSAYGDMFAVHPPLPTHTQTSEDVGGWLRDVAGWTYGCLGEGRGANTNRLGVKTEILSTLAWAWPLDVCRLGPLAFTLA